MQRLPANGKRIRGRLWALGYWKDGRPDVARFCREKGYPRQYVYMWLASRTPGLENLIRLAKDLSVDPAWLLFGPKTQQGWAGAEIRQFLRISAERAHPGRRRREGDYGTIGGGQPR